jgi:predicted RNase H-like nuclease
MTTTNLLKPLLEAMVNHERVAGQIYSITTEDVEAFLNERPDLAAKLDGLDPEVLACAIFDAIGEIGILEMVEKAIRETIESAVGE